MISNFQPPRVSVVLSFFNEADVIPELVSRLRTVFAQLKSLQTIRDHELIFVNDRSTDNSVDILKQQAVGHADIRIIHMSRNFGVAPCVMAGFQHASGDVVIYMDSDLQDPPELIPDLLKVWKDKKADVVHTVRSQRDGETWIKLAITKVGYAILKKVSNIPIRPNSGDYKLLSRRAVKHLLDLKEQRPFIRGLVAWVGFHQEELYYKRDARAAGDTKFPIFSYSVISNFLDSALISFSDAPLKLVSLLGFFFSLFSFALIGWVLFEKFQGHNIPGWTAIMTTISFFTGIQLMALGVVGLYINSIFLESKGRPLYIVESTYGFDDSSTKP